MSLIRGYINFFISSASSKPKTKPKTPSNGKPPLKPKAHFNSGAMSRALHFVTNNVPGYGPSDGRCLPCLGASGRAVSISPCSSHSVYKTLSQVKVGPLKCAAEGASYACKAGSSGHRRNPDFSRQNKHGFSGNRNRQNEDRGSFEQVEVPDVFSSKNGPLHSISSTPKFQATATPGPREKEIVELFRKVQIQLRERAAVKEEKRIEAMQGKNKESETVDSLLKLLRKHSVEQSKRKISGGGGRDFWEQPEQNGRFNGEKDTTFFDSISPLRDEPQENKPSSFTRPRSNFQRKSPVPQVQYQPIYSDEVSIYSRPQVNSDGKWKKNPVETPREPGPKVELEPEAKSELEPELELEPIFSDGEVYDEMSEDESSDNETVNDEDAENEGPDENEDLSSLKLPELRALAKSRGMKGFSKLKKSELVELLSRSSI